MGLVGPPALHFSMSTENFVSEIVSATLETLPLALPLVATLERKRVVRLASGHLQGHNVRSWWHLAVDGAMPPASLTIPPTSVMLDFEVVGQAMPRWRRWPYIGAAKI